MHIDIEGIGTRNHNDSSPLRLQLCQTFCRYILKARAVKIGVRCAPSTLYHKPAASTRSIKHHTIHMVRYDAICTGVILQIRLSKYIVSISVHRLYGA